MKLSVLMPVYNEDKWLETVVKKVVDQHVPGVDDKEIIIVDDCSQDQSRNLIQALVKKYGNMIVPEFHDKNRGKGASIQTAIQKMTGDICVIQDADLEYNPMDYPLLLEPIISGRADCVYGSRFSGSQAKRVLFFWHYVTNRILTTLSNTLTNLNFTDMETGYKAFRVDLLKSIPIRSRRFGFEPEITAKISRRKIRIYEVGISYSGRTYAEGKKITWVDGVQALAFILKYAIINDSEYK